MSTAICTSSIDNAAGQLFAMYDEDLGLILLAGKGDTIIRGYETTFLNEGTNIFCCFFIYFHSLSLSLFIYIPCYVFIIYRSIYFSIVTINKLKKTR